MLGFDMCVEIDFCVDREVIELGNGVDFIGVDSLVSVGFCFVIVE